MFILSFVCSVVVLVENVTAAGPEISVRKVAVEHDEALGAYHFDLLLFDHFASKCGGAKVSSFCTFAVFSLLIFCVVFLSDWNRHHFLVI